MFQPNILIEFLDPHVVDLVDICTCWLWLLDLFEWLSFILLFKDNGSGSFFGLALSFPLLLLLTPCTGLGFLTGLLISSFFGLALSFPLLLLLTPCTGLGFLTGLLISSFFGLALSFPLLPIPPKLLFS